MAGQWNGAGLMADPRAWRKLPVAGGGSLVHGVLPGMAEGDSPRWRPGCGRWWCGSAFGSLAHVAWGFAAMAPRVRWLGGAVAGRLYRCMGSCLGILMRTCSRLRWTGALPRRLRCLQRRLAHVAWGLVPHAAVFATAKSRIFNRRCAQTVHLARLRERSARSAGRGRVPRPTHPLPRRLRDATSPASGRGVR
jgi:hypothetical protein